MKKPCFYFWLLLLIFLLTACKTAQAEPVIPPAATPASMKTNSRLTATVSPTLAITATQPTLQTATPAQTPETPTTQGVLSSVQQQALADAALRYRSDTQEEADATVRAMNYAAGANASLTCGPLAFAILQDAGLISPYFDLNEFWLISPLPEKNEELFLEVFPLENYEWDRNPTPMAEMDFGKHPLLPGDFIYTFGGNYEHMFVVTRVDPDGKAYTVQNIEAGYLNNDPKDTSFVIAETLLYDPERPGEGVIYQWADHKNWRLGLTGTEGYQRFRPVTEIPAPDPDKVALTAVVDAIIEEHGGRWHLAIETIDGDILYARRPAQPIHPASVIKIAIAVGTMQLLETQQEAGQTLTQQLSRGPLYNETENDRSYQQLLTAMLVNSEETAAVVLYENLAGCPLKLKPMLQDWGLTDTVLEPRRSTITDLTTLYRGLYTGEYLSAESTAYLLDLMAVYTPNDDLRLGQIKSVLGEEIILYNKRGTLLSPQLIVGDTAILVYKEDVYILQIFAFQDIENSITYEELEAAIGEMAIAFGEWLKNQ